MPPPVFNVWNSLFCILNRLICDWHVLLNTVFKRLFMSFLLILWSVYWSAGDFAMANSSLRPLVLCGPSGSGKSSILSKLLEEHPNKFGFSVSHTTRKPRAGEVNGVHYHFTDRDSIQEAIDNGEFLENAVYSGNVYGTR